MEDGGVEFEEYITKKYGAAAAKRFLGAKSQLDETAAKVGITFKKDRKIFPARRAHALMEHVKLTKGEDSEEANSIMTSLFENYFEQGLSPNSVDTLSSIVKDIFGEDSEEASKALMATQDDEMLKHVLEKDSYHKHQGISGVPFFIIEKTDGEIAKKTKPITFSGAYPPEFIASELEELMNE